MFDAGHVFRQSFEPLMRCLICQKNVRAKKHVINE
jgi:hypothetical protein